jgi:signal transduction histidine kinase
MRRYGDPVLYLTNKAEGQETSTVLQKALGEPLRSEQRTGELLPRVLSRVDMLVIFITIVLFIPNASIVQATQGAGAATYVYWIIGTVTFLLPGAIVTGQLNRFMPVEGSIYVWTHRALGPLWGFFAAFCAWFPGVLVLLAAGDSIITLLQGIYVQLGGTNTNWLGAPWLQGIVVLCLLLVAGWLSTLPLHLLMKPARAIIVLYGAAIGTVGLAGFLWLLSGHAPQVSLTTSSLGFGEQNIVLYGVIVLALLGVEVPLNMAAETKEANAATLFLRWGPLLVLVAYLLGTFGVMAVVPADASALPYSTLTAVGIIFGAPMAVLAGLIISAFFILVIILYNVAFARILFVSALDHRLPTALARVNRHASPSFAIYVQTVLALLLVLFTYFLGPLLYPAEGANFSAKVYNISQATITVIWCISMIILFLDLPILLYRFRALLAKNADQLIAPSWVLYLCCTSGGVASLLGIWTTLRYSWEANLIPNTQWGIVVGFCTVIFLVIGLLGSAYPRLLSNLEEQTAVARENARLYSELRATYTRLSEVDQLKDAFLITAAHELRTPLTIMQGYLELLREMEDADPEMRRSFINKACRACDELVLLQANIMDASRIEIDIASLHYAPLSLRDTIQTVVELFEPLILQQEREMTIAVPTYIRAWADEIRLKQVLHNLISNALRYSPLRTPISITAVLEPEELRVRVAVRDYGSGIPPDKQATIFEKFVRLERDMHGTTRGSGLGLFITRQLVEAMQGKIIVESSGVPNEGSTFSFTLPLVEN